VCANHHCHACVYVHVQAHSHMYDVYDVDDDDHHCCHHSHDIHCVLMILSVFFRQTYVVSFFHLCLVLVVVVVVVVVLVVMVMVMYVKNELNV
jgi:hypothetical protein